MGKVISEILIGGGTLKIDGTDVGFTEDGVTLINSRDYYDIEADQSINILRKNKVRQTITVVTNILQSTLANIKIVWDSGSTITEAGGYSNLSFGGDTTVTEHTLQFDGVKTGGLTRKFYAYKAVSIETGEHSYKKNGKTLIPVTFELVADITKGEGKQLGYYQDELAA